MGLPTQEHLTVLYLPPLLVLAGIMIVACRGQRMRAVRQPRAGLTARTTSPAPVAPPPGTPATPATSATTSADAHEQRLIQARVRRKLGHNWHLSA